MLGADAESLATALNGAGVPVTSPEPAALRAMPAADVPETVLIACAAAREAGTVSGAGAETGADLAADTRQAAHRALAILQEWLAGERFEASRLVFVTRGAVAATDAERPDPAQAAVWGLVRAARAEHPDRFSLVDLDGTDASARGDTRRAGHRRTRTGLYVPGRCTRHGWVEWPTPTA